VTKASAPHVLVEAVHAVAAGKKYLSPELAQKLALRDFAGAKTDELSARE
jgi:DNA-binding NarL/FixJ family response regulator